MCDKQGNSYYVHYNIKEVSDQWAVGQWAVGPMGCRTNGLSNQWAVGPQGSYRSTMPVNAFLLRNNLVSCISKEF